MPWSSTDRAYCCPKPQWTARWYYIMKNLTSSKQYLGQTTQDINRYKGSGPYWVNHCKANGGYNRKNIKVINSVWVDDLEFAELFLQEFENKYGQYWLQSNLVWANQVPEDTLDNPFFENGSELSKVNNLKRVADKSHNFLKENRGQDLGNEFTSETAKLSNTKRINDSSHHLLRENETEHMREHRQNRLVGMNDYMLQNGLHPSQNDEACKIIGEKNKVHQMDRVKQGKHQFSNGFYAVNKIGNVVKISTEVYKSQFGAKHEWEYVHPTSAEAKRRRSIFNGNH